MALVNAAVTLALRGRRVLTVDFDIEAPGLDTFDVLRPCEDIPGIIDFVSQYLDSGQAPDATQFIGECPSVGEIDGKLWIMPSGKNATYSRQYSQIDWGLLYDKHDGYLLFEDLKEQWSRFLKPDYVLIDSRTGHTDTSGICTRQLPDSVVVLFFPNEQNLRGLAEVVADIRAEADEPRKKTVELHFVMSNVPDLDDEDRILESKIADFQSQLGFQREPMVVHRYDSLSLLNQVVFSKDRPRSRLASEYAEIVREVSTRNCEDRDGALEYIKRAGRHWHWMEDDSIQTREQMLTKIEDAHSSDGEVLFRLSELREADRQPESAAALVNEAIDIGYDKAEAYLKRSRFRAEDDDVDGAKEDSWRVLGSDQVAPPMVREAIRRLERLGMGTAESIVECPAVTSLELEDRFWLADTFNRSLKDLEVAVALWKQVLDTETMSESMLDDAKHSLGLSFMGLGRCFDAQKVFQSIEDDLDEMSISEAFDVGMAAWGATGRIEQEPFQRVVELDRTNAERDMSLNYFQCMALSYWAVDENRAAIEYAERAQRKVGTYRGRTEFSCWRYLQVDMGVFEKDLEEIRDLIEGSDTTVPKFMSEAVVGPSMTP